MKFLYCICFVFILSGSVFAGLQPSLVVNNRVLAKVNGKVVTVVDVMKKMDMLLFREHPDALQSNEKRYQYYMSSWQDLLMDMIDRELVLQDAEEKGIPASSGDVREELEEIFGPNVLLNLEKAQLSYEEAWQMLRADILIRRMLQFQVNARVHPKVTPNEVRLAYDGYVHSLRGSQKWVYRIVSVRGTDDAKKIQAAEKIIQLLKSGGQTFDTLEEQVQEQMKDEAIHVSVSPVFSQARQEMTESIYQTLSSLEAGAMSQPIVQKSRTENSDVVRIYCLSEKGDVTIAPFAQMESDLKEKMTRRLIFQETQEYFIQLQKQYDVRPEEIAKALPENFQPFMLR